MKFHETSHRRSGAEKTGKRRRARGDGRWTTRPCARLALMKQARNKARAPRCLLPRARTRFMPLKRPNLDVRAEFDLETNGAGKTQAKCKHCKEIVQTAKTNCDKNCEHRQAANAFGLCVPEGPGGYQRGAVLTTVESRKRGPKG